MLLTEQYRWLNKAKILIGKEHLDPTNDVSWATYFAACSRVSFHTNDEVFKPIPILLEKVRNPVIVADITNLSQNLMEHLKPGQVPWI